MRIFIMWHPPDGWVEEVNSEQEAVRIIQRQYPTAAFSNWLQEFPEHPERRLFAWKSMQSGKAGERPVAWVLTAR